MVKRTNISYKSFYYTIFAIIVMIGCWESNRTSAAVVNAEIPQQAIRLRILANSDSTPDQLVKKSRCATLLSIIWTNGWKMPKQ